MNPFFGSRNIVINCPDCNGHKFPIHNSHISSQTWEYMMRNNLITDEQFKRFYAITQANGTMFDGKQPPLVEAVAMALTIGLEGLEEALRQKKSKKRRMAKKVSK